MLLAICLVCGIKCAIKQPLSERRIVLNFSEKFKPALHTVQYSFMGRTVTFITSILLVGVLHSIVISFIFADAFNNIVDLLLNFIFVCPFDVAENIMELL